MEKDAKAASGIKSEDQLLDKGIQQLLKAVKDHAKDKGKPIKREKLLKQGYSERFIAKIEEA